MMISGYARRLVAGLLGLGLVSCAGNADEIARGDSEVILATELGDIVLQLAPDEAPRSTAAFVEWVEAGRFLRDTSGFYRVVTHENDNGSPLINVIQGGLIEIPENLDGVTHESTAHTGLLNLEGTIAVARGDVDTGSPAYFFINVTDNPGLDHGEVRNPDGQGFAVFGRVVDGMDVVRAIQNAPVAADADDPYMAGQILAEPVRFEARMVDGH